MILLITILLLLLGIFLSAFFSGCETGFYRASRVRFVIAGLDGDLISQYLIKLFNNPTLFVATTLIGNNVANLKSPSSNRNNVTSFPRFASPTTQAATEECHFSGALPQCSAQRRFNKTNCWVL
ncbi:DUF21 domain-containing protein [bacterium]|nr:DUF21 domain-containing protein [bacterium]